MAELKDYAVGTLTLLLLISLGFNISPGDTHICRETGVAMDCDRLSSTGLTCYPNADDNTGYKRCSAGWEPINTEIVDDPTEETSSGCSENERFKVCVYRK